MFVTGLLEDWMRKIEQGRQRRRHDHQLNNASRRNRQQEYETFIEKQKSIWTPPALFDKCCPHFLAGGNEVEENTSQVKAVRLKNGHWSCPGGCQKVHPTITLFFDGTKIKTVAIISLRLDPFVTYLEELVNEGKAVCRTPFYYELTGYVRENLHNLKQKQQLFGEHLVTVAMGAMEESDQLQKSMLEDTHREEQHVKQKFDRIEEVLQICRLHRLGDDLDVLSLQCMNQTSLAFRRVATPMINKRIRSCQLVVTPLVDGYFLGGYSVFRRVDNERRVVRQTEQGRIVEYAASNPIICQYQDEKDDKLSRFIPRNQGHINENNTDASFAQFTWDSEELSFANLEREWGDIGMNDYVGQKVIVDWRRGIVDFQEISATTHRKMFNALDEVLTQDLPIYDLRLNCISQKTGMLHFTKPGFRLNLNLKDKQAVQVDDVTVSFQGNAEIIDCEISFEFLVAAYARSLEYIVKEKHEQILKTRPLLLHEQAYLNLVKSMASM